MSGAFYCSEIQPQRFTADKSSCFQIKIKTATFKGCHLKLAFKVGLWSRENDNFSVFVLFFEDSDKVVYCTFLCPFRFVTATSKIPFPSIEILLNNLSISKNLSKKLLSTAAHMCFLLVVLAFVCWMNLISYITAGNLITKIYTFNQNLCIYVCLMKYFFIEFFLLTFLLP